MKLKQRFVHKDDLEKCLDEFQDKIKFVIPLVNVGGYPNIYLVIIDEE